MTNYYSTRSLGVTRDVFALPYNHKKHAFQTLPVESFDVPVNLSLREINLIRSLIEDNRTILWLDDQNQIKIWDVEQGLRSKSGVILVL